MYLGIDLGTSGIKVLLIDEQQQTITSHTQPLTISRPQSLWSEQHPSDWWQALHHAMSAIVASHPQEVAQLRGIGLSGQMHGAVLLDTSGSVLRPAILWNDTRSGEECIELEQRVPSLRHITGNAAMPGFTAPKLLWVAKHEPEIFERTAMVLLPKDYLRYLLSGECVSEMSDAAGTLWLDVQQRAWSEVMLMATGLDLAHMPRLVEGSESSGMLKDALRQAWGITQPVVIAGGAGDNAASAIGMGIISEGQGFISLGTSGVFFAATNTYRPNPAQGLHTFCHALPNEWHQMGVMLSAASCLSWVVQATHATSEANLLQEIEATMPTTTSDAPIFLPYLSGERTPHNNPHARGVWFGLQHDTNRAALGYSVLEGVAFGLLDSYKALQQAGTAVHSVSLVGGGSRSRYWAQLLANVLQLPLRLDSGAEVGAALGAARLGLLAAEPTSNVASVCAMPQALERIEPLATQHAVLMERFHTFSEIYSKLKSVYADSMYRDTL